MVKELAGKSTKAWGARGICQSSHVGSPTRMTASKQASPATRSLTAYDEANGRAPRHYEQAGHAALR
jgi:hypothetical protein